MPTIREDELTQAIEALTKARSVIDHATYHSDCLGSIHDRMADLIAECEKELEIVATNARINELHRRQSIGRRGDGPACGN